MPDIREILKALSSEDRTLWQQCRNNMRSVYLNAHNSTVGMPAWNHDDDAFLDFIDIKLATLFDRAGRLDAIKEIIGDSKTIENDLEKADDAMKAKPKVELSSGHKLLATIGQNEASDKAANALVNGWPNQ